MNIKDLVFLYKHNKLLPEEGDIFYIRDNDLKVFKYTYIDPWECYGLEYNWSKNVFDTLIDFNKLLEDNIDLEFLYKGEFE